MRAPAASLRIGLASVAMLVSLVPAALAVRHPLPAVRQKLEREAQQRRLDDQSNGLIMERRSQPEVEVVGPIELLAPPPTPTLGGTTALGRDVLANDRSLPICSCVLGGQSRRMAQREPSVAAWGRYIVMSWNDSRARCIPGVNGTTQNVAYSTDGGVTFRESGFLLMPGGRAIHGDPTVVVNPKTGYFYVTGILRQGAAFVGIGIVRARFQADTLAIDLRQAVSVSAPGDFHDKPWMAVDSLSGNVYVTWTNFRVDDTRIELQRLDGDLNALGPLQVLRQVDYSTLSGPQFSYPAVGPDGVLYVGWGLYYGDGSLVAAPNQQWEIVRSDDFGATFGPIGSVPFQWWIQTIPPGYQRGFWPSGIAMAVDRSSGPHRGRVYISWSESEDVSDVVHDTTDVLVERENNDWFASAMPFVPGPVLRGHLTAGEMDMYQFTASRGDIFAVMGQDLPDTLRTNYDLRLVCPSDTANVASYRTIAQSTWTFVAMLPEDGTYYFQVDARFTATGAYALRTALDPPTSDRASDIRDQYIAYSDDGITWSAPIRIDDAPPGTDGSWVQVAVDGRGRVHAFWMDWRDDPECGVVSQQYMASSGDGGVTWGPNRPLTDAPSFWGMFESCSDNNMGDYAHMIADGDRVFSAFTDSRLGDPDIFLDVSVFRSEGTCPEDRAVRPGHVATLDFTLTNRGNFETPLAWNLSDERGWLTGATPSLAGSTALAAENGSVVVQATIATPPGCEGESTLVRFVTSDPHVPGAADTCIAVVHCRTSVSTLLALVGVDVREGSVSLRWHGATLTGREAALYRRASGGDWLLLATIRGDGDGSFTFEDRPVPPGRYAYRLVITPPEGEPIIDEVTVDVPSLALALASPSNPSRDGELAARVTLLSSRPALIEVVDVTGRRVVTRDVGHLGPGSHVVRLAERPLPGGVYLLRVSQDGSKASSKAIVMK